MGLLFGIFGFSQYLCHSILNDSVIMITFPNAKINIGLQVTERRSDGYHNLDTVFYPIPLCDALEVIVAEGVEYDCRLHLSGLPVDGNPDSNLVVRAYRMLAEEYALPPVDVYLYKHIPTGAGLGGGSADAGYMLRLLDGMFALGLDDERLESYAARLGADCPFFIKNKPVYATGIGNVFHPITLDLNGYTVVVVKPDVFVSTKEAYSLVRPHKPAVTLDEKIKLPLAEWRDAITNDFEEGVFALHPELRRIKEKLYELGAVYAAMSGSGAALFGLFPTLPEDTDLGFEGCFCEQYSLSALG